MKAIAFKRYINNGIYVYVEIDDRLRPIRFVNEKEIKMFCTFASCIESWVHIGYEKHGPIN